MFPENFKLEYLENGHSERVHNTFVPFYTLMRIQRALRIENKAGGSLDRKPPSFWIHFERLCSTISLPGVIVMYITLKLRITETFRLVVHLVGFRPTV